MTAAPTRVLLVGWDGATWDVLDPLLAAGRLPRLAGLIAGGLRFSLESTLPPVTPPAWTAMATGLKPGRSGVLNFRHFDLRRPSGYSPRLASSADLQGRTLFEAAGTQGVGVVLVGWPLSFPPFELPGGVMLAGWPRPVTDVAPTAPAALGATLGPWGEGDPAGAGEPDLPTAIDSAAWWDRRHAEVACRWLRERDDRLAAVVFPGFDHLAHRLWGDPRLDEHLERLDAHLGALLEAAGPGCRVMLVSDHGFGPAPTRRVHLNRWLLAMGHLTLRPGGGSPGRALGALRDRSPRAAWRRLRGRIPGPVRRWGFERARGFDRLDLARTRVVRLGLYEGWDALQVLVRGRQRGGAVPAAQLDGVIDRVLGELRAATLDGGEPLVRRAIRASEAYGVCGADTPDILVELAAGCRAGDGLGPGPIAEPVPAAERLRFPGAHRTSGVGVLAGPGLRAGAPVAAHVADVGATALAWAGLTVPSGLDGRVWQECLEAPTRYGAGAPRSGSSGGGRGGGRAPEPVGSAVEEQLERLGYLS